MSRTPEQIARFLSGRRFAVAGVSRSPSQAANAIFRKLRDSGYEVFPVNPNASEVEGVRCFPNVDALPAPVDGVVIATHPNVAVDVVRQCAGSGVKHVWLHRSIGAGSISAAAIREGAARGIDCIAGGCPLMYCEPVDPAHRCMRWLLGWSGRLPR
jgi:predicted CoA-binding protein